MPLGVVHGPATFQGYINSVLYENLDLFCIAYLNDILIYSEDIKNHIHDVRKILERLFKYGLFVKLEKCVFGVSKISFLGFILTTEDIKMDLSRVSTMKNWLLPKSFRDI